MGIVNNREKQSRKQAAANNEFRNVTILKQQHQRRWIHNMGSQNFKPSSEAFPSMDQQFTGQGSQQQNQDPSASQMTTNANPFSMSSSSAKSFVPEGMVGFTDDYPNIGEAFGAAPKKKK